MAELAVYFLFGDVPQLLDDVVYFVHGERGFVLQAATLDVLVGGLYGTQAKSTLSARESHEVDHTRLVVVFEVQVGLFLTFIYTLNLNLLV